MLLLLLLLLLRAAKSRNGLFSRIRFVKKKKEKTRIFVDSPRASVQFVSSLNRERVVVLEGRAEGEGRFGKLRSIFG